MVSELNDISNSTTPDQIRLALKRIAAVSRYEARLYSARKRHVPLHHSNRSHEIVQLMSLIATRPLNLSAHKSRTCS